MSAYGEAALDRECAELAHTIASRNDRLHSAAFSIGTLVGAGEIDRVAAERALFDAALASGYVQKDGTRAAVSTIKSGLDSGILKPRQIKREPPRVTRQPSPPPPPPPPSQTDDSRSTRVKAQSLWRQRSLITGSLAETYLRTARGYGGKIPATLGFLPARGDHPSALIAAFGIVSEPEPCLLAIDDAAVMAVQLVSLKPDGSRKADLEPAKIVIGRGALGAPIVLAPPNDGLGLAITEGLEDALSVHEATGLGGWASGGAGRMPALADAVPVYIECVTVIGDDDDAGRRHARELAARLRARGFETILKFLRARPS